MRHHRNVRPRTTAAVTAVVAALAATTLSVGTATAAPADRCSQAAPTRADNPYTTTHTVLSDAPLRKGPYRECDWLQTYPAQSTVEVRCFIVNDYGNTWSYVPGAGWVWDSHLSSNGSPHRCLF
ncbi:hypothetical protein [Streptomyces peucetius]|uniref:SH3 domain-containing protein n=1 Tax=Streptomyces peucetius TaxID=1950 RepID=A0ABY6IGL8_STRPE|nr:hypothetical protein [Streptomyces peucetius]UYQ66138.1 hypothetical protein OGH68_34905 [Streptomyces peucetius]